MATIKLDATAGAINGWFDKKVTEEILAMPRSQRDAAALRMQASAVKGVGPGSQTALGTALDRDTPTVRDFLRFMGKPNAGSQLTTAAQETHQSTLVVGKLYTAYNLYVGAIDGI